MVISPTRSRCRIFNDILKAAGNFGGEQTYDFRKAA